MMMLLQCSVLAALATAAVCGPVVDTSQGKMEGATLLSRDGREYSAFTRIPYGKSPIGQLRFMPPLPGEPWEGVLNATIIAPMCYQKPFLLNQQGMLGQEDCLFLNVFTPNINASYPVLVYIHGGSFVHGWPGNTMKPNHFMDEDVVVVTINYRLGYFGFLSMEDEVLPGNYGMKDQVLAVEWVKKEIANFGGNPELITAFGISAGGASTHYLCSIPKSRELLKGCISQSGVGGTIWALHYPGDAKKVATKFIGSIGCGNYSGSDLILCLQSKPVDLFFPDGDLAHITSYTGPVLEVPSDSAVITQWPTDYSDFPWITGVVANEGMIVTGYLDYFGTFIQKLAFLVAGDELLSQALHLKENVILELIKINERFIKLKDIFHIFTEYEKLMTEAFWVYPLLTEMQRHTGPKYFYRFEYAGGPTLWEAYANKSLEVKGLCHGDDSFYYFNLSNYYQPEGWPGPKDVELSKTLVKMWVNFAAHQVPSAENVQWDEFGDNASYLDITNEGLSMKNYTNFKDVLNFWDNIK